MAETFAQPARQCLIPGLVPRALPARRGGAELPDLQRRPLHRTGAVRPDDRRLGRGPADRLQLLRLPVRQPDHVPAAARPGGPPRPPLDPQRVPRRDRGHPLRGPAIAASARCCCSPRRSECCCARCRRCCRLTSPICSAATPAGLATLASTMGFAALVGGTLVAIRGRLAGLTRIAVLAGLALALATASFVATHHFAVGVVCIARDGRRHHDARHLDPDAAAELRLRPRWWAAC